MPTITHMELSEQLTVDVEAEEAWNPELCSTESSADTGGPETFFPPADEDQGGPETFFPPASPTSYSSGWYTENCDDCCHPITDAIIDYMSIKVAIITTPAYSDSLAGTDVSAIVDAAVINGDAVVNTIDPRNHAAGLLSNTMVKTKSDGSKAYSLNYTTSFPLEENLDYLEVVTYMDLDIDRMKADYGLDTSYKSYKNMKTDLFNFKATSEKVIADGATVDSAYVFKNTSDGTQWDGPVHYHPSKGYMGGETHTKLPHPSLTRIQVPNIKIKNNTIKDQILSIDIGKSLNSSPNKQVESLNTAPTFISNAITSKATDGKTRFLFYVDYANLIKSESYFPGLKDDSIYANAPITSLQIYRQRGTLTKDKTEFGISKVSDDGLENNSVEKDLVVSSADIGGSQNANSSTPPRLSRSSRMIDKDFDGVEETLVGGIEEISVANLTNQGFRIFSVTDDEIAEFTSGEYRYTTEIQIKDPTIDYINQKLSTMCMAKDKLEDLSARILGTPCYDSVNKRFSNRYKARYGKKHMAIVTEALTQIVDLINVINGRKSKKIINYVLSIASVQSGSPEGLETLVEIMESFEGKLISALDGNLSMKNSYDANIEKDVSFLAESNAYSGLLMMENDFDILIDRSASDLFGYEYVPAAAQSFPMITADSYSKRQTEETEKFYGSTGTRTSDTSTNLSKSKKSALSSGIVNYGFLTPSAIWTGDTPMNLIGENSEIADLKKYNEAKLKITQVNSPNDFSPAANLTVLEMSEQMLTGMGVSIGLSADTADKAQNYTDDTVQVFGENNFNSKDLDVTFESNLSAGDELFVEQATNILGSVVGDKAAQAGSLDPDSVYNADQEIPAKDLSFDPISSLSIQHFDLTKENNLLTQKTATEIRNMPPGVKSLFLSRSKSSRNWVDHDRDLFQDPELKDFYRFNQGMTVKIEYLSGHGVSQAGKSLKSERYKPLTSRALGRIQSGQPLLVRISPIVQQEYNIGTDLGLTMPVYTENFLIAPGTSGQRTRPTKVVDRTKQITNYVMSEVNRLTFDESGQLTTVINKSF